MVISQLISSYSGFFQDKKEMYLFLEEIFKKDISYFYAHQDQLVEDENAKLLLDYAKRRIKNEPVAYILKKAYFYGSEFVVDEGILIPRSDTETLVDQAILDSNTREHPNILDLACGSGCIGISIAKHVKTAKVTLSDISDKCISVSSINLKLNNVQTNCQVRKSDLFQDITGKFDLIVSNPPYIPLHEYVALDKQVLDYEPKLALLAGEDGTEFYTAIVSEAKSYLNDGASIMFEVGYNQAESLEVILKDQGYREIFKVKDTQGIDRVVCAKYYIETN